MAIQVQAPNGDIVEFPDGMADADIEAVMKREYMPAPQPTGALAVARDVASGAAPPTEKADPNRLGPTARPAMIAAQGIGAGIANTLTAPADLAGMAANPLMAAADWASQKLGGPEISLRFGNAGRMVRDAGAAKLEAVGVPLQTPETFGEKLLYNIADQGTQSALFGGALGVAAKARGAEMAAGGARPALFDPLLKPYIDAPVKARIGDLAAGAGGGAGLTLTRELPDRVREMGGGTVGVLADFAGQMAGSVAGGGAATMATGAPGYLVQKVKDALPDQNIPINPDTGMGYTRRAADLAARHIQGAAAETPLGPDAALPAKAAETIKRAAASYVEDGLPVPTAGTISDNAGLIALEQGQRNANPVPFRSQDNALRGAAVENVNALKPAGASPDLYPQVARDVAEAKGVVAQKAADKAVGEARAVQIGQKAAADDLEALRGQGASASGQIDTVYRDTRGKVLAQNRANYDDPALQNSRVDATSIEQTAARIAGEGSERAPLDPVVTKYTERLKPRMDEGGSPLPAEPLTGQEIQRLIADISADIQTNRANGSVVRQLGELKDTLKGFVDTIAESGGPGAQAAENARTYYAETVAPNFRKGAGGRLDAKIKMDPTGYNTRPTDTAGMFLNRPEDAADLLRLAKTAGKEQEVAAASRTWLLDKLASRGIAAGGAIDPEKLVRWRNVNDGVIAQVPGLRQEIDGMLRRAQRGEALSSEYAGALKRAEANVKQVGREVSAGPLGTALDSASGAPKETSRAVTAVFSSANPQATMAGLVKEFGRRPDAQKSLQAAVADHFVNKVTSANGGGVAGVGADGLPTYQAVNYGSLVREFNKNERALAELYSPEQMNTLRRAQKALQPLTKLNAQASRGSITAENRDGIWKMMRVALSPFQGNLKAGGTVARLRDSLALTFGNDDVAQANELVKRMFFDPELAGHLLTREVQQVGTPAWNDKLQRLLRWTEAARETNENAAGR